jgi:hypothetical protein
MRQLHYTRASQQSQTLRLLCTSVHNQLHDRTLQQSILLPANSERTTAAFADLKGTQHLPRTGDNNILYRGNVKTALRHSTFPSSM